MPRGFDRRCFLRAGGAMLLTACAPAPSDSAGASGPGGDSAAPTDDTAPTGDDTAAPAAYPCGQTAQAGAAGWFELPLATWPDLAEVGGWYHVDVGGHALVVAHVSEGCYSAMERACSHAGTAVEYRPDRGQYVCPNHGALYGADGEAISGPQPTGLPVYPCGRVDDAVWVQLG